MIERSAYCILMYSYHLALSLQDMRKHVRVVIVEAGENLLGSFDSHLQSYVKRKFESRQIELMTCCAVQRVCPESVLLERKFVGENPGELRLEICIGFTTQLVLLYRHPC